MSVERSLEAWEEVQRHGLDLADRLAQGFSGLLQTHNISPPPFPSWSPPHPLSSNKKLHTKIAVEDFAPAPIKGIDQAVPSAIFDIGSRIGQAGAELGACFNGVVQQLLRHLPVPFRPEEDMFATPSSVPLIRTALKAGGGSIPGVDNDDGDGDGGDAVRLCEHREASAVALGGKFQDGTGFFEPTTDETGEEEGFDPSSSRLSRHFARPQGSFNVTSTYDSRTCDFESSLAARGDLWRAEASHGGSTSGSESSPPFLLQLGPVLLIRDTTLLLPVHLSKQHQFWYGYDRKNGLHLFSPALWSKHRRWLLKSMICLNPLACSYLEVQFPNGQLTYVAGERLTTTAFLPLCGGLLQVQGQYPGETRLSFSCKSKFGTHITPMFQWPDNSFSLGLGQSLAWRRSGMLLRPAFQFSMCPTFGGNNPGMKTEFVHSVKDAFSIICGFAFSNHPSAHASIAVGRSKWNGHVGTSGVVVKVETPLGSVGRPSFSVQLNTGAEF